MMIEVSETDLQVALTIEGEDGEHDVLITALFDDVGALTYDVRRAQLMRGYYVAGPLAGHAMITEVAPTDWRFFPALQ